MFCIKKMIREEEERESQSLSSSIHRRTRRVEKRDSKDTHLLLSLVVVPSEDDRRRIEVEELDSLFDGVLIFVVVEEIVVSCRGLMDGEEREELETGEGKRRGFASTLTFC